MVKIGRVRAAIGNLSINIDNGSIDDAYQLIVGSDSDTTSTMLVRATADDLKSFQSYTIRWLDQK